MALKIQHGSLSISRTIDGDRYQYTLYGSQADVMAEDALRLIGSPEPDDENYPGFTLVSSVPKPADGNGWYTLELVYQRRSNGSTPSSSAFGPTESELNVRTMELPLEACKKPYFGAKYRTNWNWILIGKGAINPTTKIITPPAESEWLTIWTNATDTTALTDNDNYRWVKDPNDRPTKENGFGWVILKDKTKPGVESFLFPSVEINERGYHTSSLDAAWVVKHAGIRAIPLLGTFGITSGEWLCMGGTVSKQGGYWVATCSYQWSLDAWDHDLYAI